MIKILFICHGNICRSAAAKMVMQQMIRERGLEGTVTADSAATSREEIGNDVYPPMKRALRNSGYVCGPHAARQTVRADYEKYDCIVGMDDENMRDMRRIYGGDPAGKLSYLMAWAGQPGRNVEDPWYTGNFEGVLSQIEAGCRGMLEKLRDARPGGLDAGRA